MEKFFDPDTILDIAKKLVSFRSVTNTPGEKEAAEFIYGYFHEAEYFRINEGHLLLLPAEKQGLRRNAVLAYVKAEKDTKRTVLLNGHFDVVDVDVCGELAQFAFDPDRYTREIGRLLPEGSEARRDWESGNWLFGRGIMDMKFGLAVYMAFMREKAERRTGLNINLLFLAVPDEEGDSAGMRGSLPYLCSFVRERGLELAAALSGEPAFWKKCGALKKSAREWFTGTTGKIMPLFFCLGHEAHAGFPFEGVSSAVMASEVVLAMEGHAYFCETAGDEILPHPVCLKIKDLRENYSVTLPEKAVAYFNVLTVSKTPRDVMRICKAAAESALRSTMRRIRKAAGAASSKTEGKTVRLPEWEPAVFSAEEIRELAARNAGKASPEDLEREILSSFPENMDAREKGMLLLDRLIGIAGLKGPAIVIGFLPPYYPYRINTGKTHNEKKLRKIMESLRDQVNSQTGGIELTECFSGIMDLSFMGFQGAYGDLAGLSANMPGWGNIFCFSAESLASLDVPLASVGPAGKDAHQATERLELEYSLHVAPSLLDQAVQMLGED